MCDHEGCNGDARSVPMPEQNDPHGWTVAFQIILDSQSIFRTIGWVGDHASAEKVAMIAAMIYGPILTFGAVPAPRTDEPDGLVAITERPASMPDDFPLDPSRMTAVPAAYLRGTPMMTVRDAMMPTPVLTAAKVVELLEAKDVDVEALYNDGHGKVARIQAALGEEGMAQVVAAFPTDTMTIGIRREDLPCICGNNCNGRGH